MEISDLTLKRLEIGAKPGQAILFVDLSTIENPESVIAKLSDLGYPPNYHYLSLRDGFHVVSLIKEKFFDDPTGPSDSEYETLETEWINLSSALESPSVRLWVGRNFSVAA